MRMTGSRTARVTLALTAILVLAAPATSMAQEVPASCVHAATPPAPPQGGGMLWAPPQSTDDRNAVMIPPGINSSWNFTFTNCGNRVVQSPRVISVDRGAVMTFVGLGENREPDLMVNWGAVNVGLSDPPPVIVPDAAKVGWVQTYTVAVGPAAEPGGGTWSCRGCDFADAKVAFDVPPSGFGIGGYAGDFTGATFRGTLTGSARSFNFTGADLSGATANGVDFSGATFDHTIVDRTSFDGAKLQGATFTSLQFRTPPTFARAQVGNTGAGGACTSVANTNLLNVDFSELVLNFQECPNPSFPGSQITPLTFQRVLGSGPDLSAAQVVVSTADRGFLAGASLSRMNLAGVAFLGEALDLTGTNFDNATLTGTSFGLARLAGASFVGVNAARASFNFADLYGDGTHRRVVFGSGISSTNLQGANFVNANVSGAIFNDADLTDANFTGALGVNTEFNGVTATGAVFTQVHLYGTGKQFQFARDLQDIDFTGAVLAGDASGGLDLTGALLGGARFDNALCVACNLTNATLTGASFVGAYLPGVVLSGAQLGGANFDRAWLYCGGPTNPKCASVPQSQPPQWDWPLALGSGEAFGPVPFAATNLTGANLNDVSACPNGKAGSTSPGGCAGIQLLPRPSEAPPIPAPCSAAARGACPTPTSTLLDTTPTRPLAVVSTAPPTWNTTLSDRGYYVAFDDGTVRLVSTGTSTIVAGTAGTKCAGATAPCGDGGPATRALLGAPTGLAVGLDGSLYIADPAPVLRVRVIDPDGIITTLAGTGLECPTIGCGDGGPAASAPLKAANGVAVDTRGVLLIADGFAGVRRVATDGTLTTLAPGTSTGTVVSVVGSANGPIYAATRGPGWIIQIDPTSGAVTRVVGTDAPGYNGNTDPFSQKPLPGTEVQVNQPTGLAVDLDGNVLFADSANHLIRAYVPSTTHVIDLAGQVIGLAPQGGFNGDGHFATDTELNVPLGVTATRGPLRVVADTANLRVRQVAGPANMKEGPSSEVVVSCRPGPTSSCRRLTTPPAPVATGNTGAVTISQGGTVFATGRSFLPVSGRLRLHVTEHQPLLPGRYDLVIVQAGRPRHQTIWIDQAPDLTERRRP